MAGNYEKNMYKQLVEVMERLDILESENKVLKKEIKYLSAENNRLQFEVDKLKEENKYLRVENARLAAENEALKEDNERMKRSLSNNSENSSIPPSQDKCGKPVNTYNSRKTTGKKVGAQLGHKGKNISKNDVKEKIKKGIYKHRIQEIGVPGEKYVTRYILDLDIEVTATEVKIYCDGNGKYDIPDELKADVTYGKSIKAITNMLYAVGVVSNDRICEFLNSISGDTLKISTGTIYNICKDFSEKCKKECTTIKEHLLNSNIIYTDATCITKNGQQTYIRNFSTDNYVLYYGTDKKDLKSLETMDIIQKFRGIYVHDHETGLYNFGIGHGECNVHICRYLRKNSEETGNKWSDDFKSFLCGLNDARNKLKELNIKKFDEKAIKRYYQRYDEIITHGEWENKKTSNKYAKKHEKALLNRLIKYKENHLLFLKNFEVEFSNNKSEKDLRICKNREKMAGGFRTSDGRSMYCNIMSFIETIKRQKLNIFQNIMKLLNGTPVIV